MPFAGALPSRYEQLETERPEHYAQFEQAAEAVVEGYVSNRPLEAARWDVGFVEYMRAHYQLIGYTPDNRCSTHQWIGMEQDGALDPFVEAMVNFVRVERQRRLDIETPDGYVFQLIGLRKNSFGATNVAVFGGETDMAAVATVNDLIIILAKKIAEEETITASASQEEFHETETPFNALIASAKVIHYIMQSYVIGSITNPVLEA